MPDYIQVTINDDPGSVAVTIDAGLLPTGGSTGQVLGKLSATNSHVGWLSSVGGITAVTPFTDVDEMLASESGTWAFARILDTYTQPLLTIWNCVLKTEGTLVPNGNSILEMDDELAYAVRILAIPQV